jgi:hypothetical protein
LKLAYVSSLGTEISMLLSLDENYIYFGSNIYAYVHLKAQSKIEKYRHSHKVLHRHHVCYKICTHLHSEESVVSCIQCCCSKRWLILSSLKMMLKAMLKLSCNKCVVKYLISDTLLLQSTPCILDVVSGQNRYHCHLVEARTELSLLLGSDWLGYISDFLHTRVFWLAVSQILSHLTVGLHWMLSKSLLLHQEVSLTSILFHYQYQVDAVSCVQFVVQHCLEHQ